MRRWMLRAGVTDVDGMILEEVAMPEPGPGEVRIRIHAVSLNYRDQFVLTEHVPTTWRTPGRDLVPVSDGAGEIDALGDGVSAWAIGNRVTPLYFRDWVSGRPRADLGFGLGSRDQDGMLTEYIVLPASRLIRVPDSLGYAEASTLPCAGLTAWSSLQGDLPVDSGSRVLVLGTGGVSLMAVVLARGAGAEVFATTSQDAKRQQLLDLGVSEVFNYRETPEWGQAVQDRTGGVDRVVNSVGTSEMVQSVTALRFGGEIAVSGLFSVESAMIDFASVRAKGASIRSIAVGSASAHAAMVRFIDEHEVKPPIGPRFRFEDAPAAFRAQASPDTFGKIVIDVA